MFKNTVTKSSLKHPQWLASAGRDCSRRCRQCLCSSSWSRADGRALCALSIPQYLTRRVVAVVLYCARFSIHKVSPGWKACAGRCAPRHPGTGHPGTGHRAPRRDKQGTGCPLIVSQQMLLGITPRTIFRQPHSTAEKCDIGRTLGAINPSSSGGQLAFWSFSNSNPCRQNFC